MASINLSRTSNPISEYTFSWEIKNFRRIPSLKLDGVAFSPIKGYYSNLKFSLVVEVKNKKAFNLIVGLKPCFTLSSKDSFTVKCQIALTSEGYPFPISSNPDTIYMLEPFIVLMSCSSLEDCFFADDKLILAGTITFSGYNVSTTACPPLPVQPPESLENCIELPKNVKTLYEGGLASGVVTFSVDQKKLAAHKAILCSHSPVFEKMFEHNMVENNTNDVTIEDIDFCTFNGFLAFLYTGAVQEDKYEGLASLYSVAKKYDVKSLQEVCFSILTNKLAVGCVCDILVLADLHDDIKLKEAAKIFFSQHVIDIVVTTKWTEFVATQSKLTQEVVDYIKDWSK